MEDSALHGFFDAVVLPAGRVALLGAGREGESSYRLLRRLYPQLPITVCDRNEGVRTSALWQGDPAVDFATGHRYIEAASAFPLIVKSPGVCLKDWPGLLQSPALTSQADLFLRFFGRQCVGVTGTKGKSTVSHLIYHLLQAEFLSSSLRMRSRQASRWRSSTLQPAASARQRFRIQLPIPMAPK